MPVAQAFARIFPLSDTSRSTVCKTIREDSPQTSLPLNPSRFLARFASVARTVAPFIRFKTMSRHSPANPLIHRDSRKNKTVEKRRLNRRKTDRQNLPDRELPKAEQTPP
jgi:hypothetical protein